MSDRPSERLASLGITLPPPPRPAGAYTPVVLHQQLAFVSGQIALENGAIVSPGLVDRDVTIPAAQQVARRAALQGLSALQAELGSVDRIRRFVRVGVFVASSSGFVRQHEVANGATEVLIQLWGDSAKPVRTSVGVPGLPLNAPVEVEMIVEFQ
jgi:enamine deaminase RidA (YjgF/YER057c/UK114 family)